MLKRRPDTGRRAPEKALSCMEALQDSPPAAPCQRSAIRRRKPGRLESVLTLNKRVRASTGATEIEPRSRFAVGRRGHDRWERFATRRCRSAPRTTNKYGFFRGCPARRQDERRDATHRHRFHGHNNVAKKKRADIGSDAGPLPEPYVVARGDLHRASADYFGPLGSVTRSASLWRLHISTMSPWLSAACFARLLLPPPPGCPMHPVGFPAEQGPPTPPKV